MRLLSLDLSTHAGWALFDLSDGPPTPLLLNYGVLELPSTAIKMGPGFYPWNYRHAANTIADQVLELVRKIKPDRIVIEETNLGKQRYSQKILEWVHKAVLDLLALDMDITDVTYISTSSWRSCLELRLTKEDKRSNSRLSRAKSKAKKKGQKLDKKKLGVKGRKNWKHLAIEFVNKKYDLALKVKDNDVADAICLGTAFLRGAGLCDGTGNFN